MLKKFFKLLFFYLLIIITLSSLTICYADEPVVTSETETITTSESEESSTSEQEIYNGDLYLFDNDIVMDKLVDGNVFIFGSNVEITGQVNGNLFVLAKTLKFNKSFVRYDIFACANSIYYDGACNDLYVATSNLEMTYDSYVIRDVKAIGTETILKSAIGRDVDLLANNINFGEGENIPVIYGNLRYTANKEIELPEGILTENGSVTYSPTSDLNNSNTKVSTILIEFITCIITFLVIYLIIKKCTPTFDKKLSNTKLSVSKLLKAFGLGLASLIAVLLISFLLLISTIGAKLVILLLLIYSALCLIAVPTLAIIITNILKPVFKIDKTSMFCLVLALTSIVLHGFTVIPFIGNALGFITKIIGIGLLIIFLCPTKFQEQEQLTSEKTQEGSKEVISVYKNENNIFSIVIAIILVIILILIFNIPNLIMSYQTSTSSTDFSDSSLNTSQEILEKTEESTDNIQE